MDIVAQKLYIGEAVHRNRGSGSQIQKRWKSLPFGTKAHEARVLANNIKLQKLYIKDYVLQYMSRPGIFEENGVLIKTGVMKKLK